MPDARLVVELRRAQTVYRKQGLRQHARECHRIRGAMFDTRNPSQFHTLAQRLIEGAYV